MSEIIIKDEIKDFEVLVNDIQDNLINRTENIQKRLENIKLEKTDPKIEKDNKWWSKIFSKSKKATKGSAAIATKAIIDVELLASQEEAAGELKFEGLGLLDKIRAGKKKNKEISEDEGNILLDMIAKIKGELIQRIDNAEEKISIVNDKAELKEKKEILFPDKITNLNEAYKIIEDIYKKLSNRLDIIEEKLIDIEPDLSKGIEKDYAKTISDSLGYEGEEPKIFKRETKLGKYDVNVIFPAIKNRTLEEHKDYVYNTYSDKSKTIDNYNMQNGRINKLIKYGFVELKDNKYIITDKGREASKCIDKSFEFTSYDANVVFNYINKHAGKLSLEDLKDSLKKEYKNEKDVERQFKYLQKRLENNVKGDYLFKTQDGFYAITDKGNEIAAKIKNKTKKRKNGMVL